VIVVKDEVVGLSMGAGGNKPVHGKRLVVEFSFLEKKSIRSCYQSRFKPKNWRSSNRSIQQI
jgi:hypothetical protein